MSVGLFVSRYRNYLSIALNPLWCISDPVSNGQIFAFLKLPDTSFHAPAPRDRAGRPASAAGGEECLQQRGGVFGTNARRDFDAVIDSRMVEDGEARAHRASLGIIGAINEPRHACL